MENREVGVVKWFNAAKGFGYVAAFRAMTRAIEKARGSGVSIVGVRHSNHFGIAGYYARMALKEDMLGVLQAISRQLFQGDLASISWKGLSLSAIG